MDKRLNELIKKAMKGDNASFEELIRLKQRDIVYIVSRYSSPDDVEDNTQEVLIKLYTELRSLKNAESFNAWMYSIIKNTCNYRLRRKNARQNIVDIVSLDAMEDYVKSIIAENRREFLPEDFVEDEEKRKLVMDAIDRLPERYRECLLLYYYGEMSYKEIAIAMGMERKQVDNLLITAKKVLKKSLEAITKKEFIYSVAPAGAVPMLTKLYQADAAATVTPELCERLFGNVHEVLRTSKVHESGSLNKVGKTGKLLFGTVITAGIAIGGYQLFKPESPRPNPVEVTQVAKESIAETKAPLFTATESPPQTPPPTDTPEAPPAEGIVDEEELPAETPAEETVVEQPIETLEDMIGEEEAYWLRAYTDYGTSLDEIVEFAMLNEMELRNEGYGKNAFYNLYSLEKQDKQLLVITRQYEDEDYVSVNYQFGVTQPVLEITSYILMFAE